MLIGGAIGLVLTITLQLSLGTGSSRVSMMSEFGLDETDAATPPMDMSDEGGQHQYPPRPVSPDAPIISLTPLVCPPRPAIHSEMSKVFFVRTEPKDTGCCVGLLTATHRTAKSLAVTFPIHQSQAPTFDPHPPLERFIKAFSAL